MKPEEKEFYKKLGAALRHGREARGLNQAELGELVGLSREAISSIENAHNRTFAHTLDAIVSALGGYVVFGSENAPMPEPTPKERPEGWDDALRLGVEKLGDAVTTINEFATIIGGGKRFDQLARASHAYGAAMKLVQEEIILRRKAGVAQPPKEERRPSFEDELHRAAAMTAERIISGINSRIRPGAELEKEIKKMKAQGGWEQKTPGGRTVVFKIL